MKRYVFATLAALAGALTFATIAPAAILYDQNVTGGIFYGTGNSNGGFTVDQNAAAGVELGLRAHTRFPASDDSAAGIMSHGNGVYGNFAAQGFFSNGTLGGPRASWNFDFSVNSNFNGNGGSLSGLSYLLKIDYDPSAGTNFLSFNPVTGLPDNGLNGNNIAQNSEQLNFFSGPLPFNPNVSGIYDIQLQAFNGNTLVASTGIQVLVGDAVLPTPEPGSLALWSLVGIGGVFYRWRRKA